MLILNKLLPIFLLPIGASLLLILGGLLLSRPRLCWLGAALLWLCSTPLVGNTVMRAAEGYAVRQSVQDALQAPAIVVLSGATTRPYGAPDKLEWDDAIDRFDAGVALIDAGKAPLLILTGGWIPWQPEAEPEGDALARMARARGMSEEAILVTGRVRNTAEEARAVAELVAAQPHLSAEPLLLVTSAYHMRRAQLLFAQAGIRTIPFPVDFQTEHGIRLTVLDVLPDAKSLWNTERALREFYGYGYYQMTKP